MGYDMYWRVVPDDEERELREVSERFNTLVKARDAIPREEAGTFDHATYHAAAKRGESPDDQDVKFHPGQTARYTAAQDAVTKCYYEMQDVQKSYFRIGAFSMSSVLAVMNAAGMIFEDDNAPFPVPADHNLTYEQVNAVRDDYYRETRDKMTPEEVQRAEAFAKLTNDYLAAHVKEIPGIPAHKLCSNDGWVVTPPECEAAVKMWMDFTDENGADAARNVVENNGYNFRRWNEWVAFIAAAASHGGFEVH